jgi:glucose/arabinose dehydrogenase
MRVLAASFAALILSQPAWSQDRAIESEQADFRLVTVAQGLEYPWSMAFLPDGDMLVSEREGRLRYVEDGTLRETPIAGLPADLLVERQGGLMGVALHPEFETNRWVYFAYAAGRANANRTALARGRLSEDGTALEAVEELFRVNFEKERGFHFGGRIQFLPDYSLVLTLGDGALYRDEAQNLGNHLGTTIRINDDGTVPFDNPFVSARGVRPEIYTYGHRNIQGIAINPENGEIWTHEHGARGGDEINVLEPGLNFGWPEVTYGVNYNGSAISDATAGDAFQEPIWYWVPSIAPSGMEFYSGDAFPEWQGDLFVGALVGTRLVRYETNGSRIISEEDLLVDLEIRFRDVQSGPDGRLYLLTDDFDGEILALEPVTR